MKKFLRITLLFICMLALICVFTKRTYASSVYDASKKYSLECDVDKPLTLEEIVSKIGLEAYDELDNVSDTISCYNGGEYLEKVLNVPTANNRELGTYTLTFKASDSHGNVAYCNIDVVVKDKKAPTVLFDYCINEISFNLSEIISSNEDIIGKRVIQCVKAIDSHDMFNLRYELASEPDLTCDEQMVEVYIYDTSNNRSSYAPTVYIVDDLKPRFSMDKAYLLVDSNDNTTVNDIISDANIKAYNSKNQEMSVSVKNTGNPSVFNTEGIYIITFEAQDGTKQTSVDFYLEVLDKKAPSFSLNENVLVVTTNTDCASDKVNSLIKMRSSNALFTYEVLEDDYTLNKEKTGDYDYKVLVTYDDGKTEELNLTLRVVEENKEEENSDVVNTKEPFFKKVINALKKVSRILFGIMKWPYLQLKTLF